jgi:hypothetical protein
MLRKIFLVLLLALLLSIGGFLIWSLTPLGPSPAALAALQPGESVQITREQNWLLFEPQLPASTGFIFYPGGRVDYRSYAPVLLEIAARGYLVALLQMPLNLAVLGVDRADDVIASHPEISVWVLGGHSLGGSMAASYIFSHPDAARGLVLWASYPAQSNDLSDFDLRVLSLSGSRDGVINHASFEGSLSLLPDSTQWISIEGGNHAGFGSYGEQPGDNTASISPAEQTAQVIALTTAFLVDLSE